MIGCYQNIAKLLTHLSKITADQMIHFIDTKTNTILLNCCTERSVCKEFSVSVCICVYLKTCQIDSQRFAPH